MLGVTGIDYGNMLIERSSDFTPFKQVLENAYPDPSLYPVIADLMQQLWDRGDPTATRLHDVSIRCPGRRPTRF